MRGQSPEILLFSQVPGPWDVSSGFSKFSRKSSVQEKKGSLLEDDSGLLEHIVFRMASDPGRVLRGVGRWGLRDESDGPFKNSCQALPNLVAGQSTS